MKGFALAGLLTLAAAGTFAQTPPPSGQSQPSAPSGTTGQASQSPAKVDLATVIRNGNNFIKGNLLKSAEKMGEADYAFKPPGIMPEVRTYGQFIGHLADANYLFCARAKGEANPMGQTSIEKTKTTRAELIKALNDAMAYCDTVYSALTDQQALEYVTVPGPNNTTRQVVRASPLITNNQHNNEHYGNLVTYMRVKGIVPPSSEPRQ
jgi:uncharacterized damage-inducible protein DinB